MSKGSLVELICKADPAILAPSAAAAAAAAAAGKGPAASGQAPLPPLPAGPAAPGAHAGPAGSFKFQQQQQQQMQGVVQQGEQQPGQQQQQPQEMEGVLQQQAAGVPQRARAVDFVLAVGDDRSDEDMFTAIEHYADTPRHPAEVRAQGSTRWVFWCLLWVGGSTPGGGGVVGCLAEVRGQG